MVNSIELQVLGAWEWNIKVDHNLCTPYVRVQIGLLNNVGDLIISGSGEHQSSEVFSGDIFIVNSPLDVIALGMSQTCRYE